MVRRIPLYQNTMRELSSLPSNVQVQLQLRKRLKFLSRSSLSLVTYCHASMLIVIFLFLLPAAFLFRKFVWHHKDFDDVQDMKLLEQEDALYLEQRRNKSVPHFAHPLARFNLTEINESRNYWDFLYGEIVRKPGGVVLTKYKTRLLRALLKKAQYQLVRKFTPALGVSCNYFNDIGNATSPNAFECISTSHKCPDGGFSLHNSFTPREGSAITWGDVVIVMLLSAGRESFIQAAAQTWIPRLREEATLFLIRDIGQPAIPESLRLRPNTYIYDFKGNSGLDNLDFKSFYAWNIAHSIFSAKGKKYFLKLDDDAFLVGHNLIRFLNRVEQTFSGAEDALYFGHPFCGHGDLKALGNGTWCYAGGGAYGLSIEALAIFVNQVRGGCSYFYDYIAKAPSGMPENDNYGGHYEDVMVGKCLRQAKNRYQRRGTSLLACGSFIPYAPLHYYEKFGRNKEAMYSKLQGDFITIHNLDPSAIHFLDHLLYEYPLGGDIGPFSPENEHVQELIDSCHMDGKKMKCDVSLSQPM